MFLTFNSRDKGQALELCAIQQHFEVATSHASRISDSHFELIIFELFRIDRTQRVIWHDVTS